MMGASKTVALAIVADVGSNEGGEDGQHQSHLCRPFQINNEYLLCIASMIDLL